MDELYKSLTVEQREDLAQHALGVFSAFEDRSESIALPKFIDILRRYGLPTLDIIADMIEKPGVFRLQLKRKGRSKPNKYQSGQIIHMAWAYKDLREELEGRGEKKAHDKACAILSKTYGFKGQAFSALVKRAWRNKTPR